MCSSKVEREAVNFVVVGSIPTTSVGGVVYVVRHHRNEKTGANPGPAFIDFSSVQLKLLAVNAGIKLNG